MNETTTFKTFTVKDVEEFGNRLHINTVINTILNGLAVYLIATRSTKAMKMTKRFISLTIFGAYLLDFHVSFLFGLFTLIPYTIVCSAGILKIFGWTGVVVNWALMHVTVSFGGMSIFFALLYQYYSLNSNPEIFKKPRIIAAMFATMILYGFPPAIISYANADYEYGITYVEHNISQHFQLYTTAACYTNKVNIWVPIWVLDVIFQIAFAFGIAIILAIKNVRKLQTLKSSMSKENLKVQKQFFVALIVQLSIPFIFMVIPLTFLIVELLLGAQDIAELSHWVIQFFSFHSSGNAVAVMLIFKPYRMALFEWIKRIKRFVFCQSKIIPLVAAVAATTTSSGILTTRRR